MEARNYALKQPYAGPSRYDLTAEEEAKDSEVKKNQADNQTSLFPPPEKVNPYRASFTRKLQHLKAYLADNNQGRVQLLLDEILTSMECHLTAYYSEDFASIQDIIPALGNVNARIKADVEKRLQDITGAYYSQKTGSNFSLPRNQDNNSPRQLLRSLANDGGKLTYAIIKSLKQIPILDDPKSQEKLFLAIAKGRFEGKWELVTDLLEKIPMLDTFAQASLFYAIANGKFDGRLESVTGLLEKIPMLDTSAQCRLFYAIAKGKLSIDSPLVTKLLEQITELNDSKSQEQLFLAIAKGRFESKPELVSGLLEKIPMLDTLAQGHLFYAINEGKLSIDSPLVTKLLEQITELNDPVAQPNLFIAIANGRFDGNPELVTSLLEKISMLHTLAQASLFYAINEGKLNIDSPLITKLLKQITELNDSSDQEFLLMAITGGKLSVQSPLITKLLEQITKLDSTKALANLFEAIINGKLASDSPLTTRLLAQVSEINDPQAQQNLLRMIGMSKRNRNHVLGESLLRKVTKLDPSMYGFFRGIMRQGKISTENSHVKELLKQSADKFNYSAKPQSEEVVQLFQAIKNKDSPEQLLKLLVEFKLSVEIVSLLNNTDQLAIETAQHLSQAATLQYVRKHNTLYRYPKFGGQEDIPSDFQEISSAYYYTVFIDRCHSDEFFKEHRKGNNRIFNRNMFNDDENDCQAKDYVAAATKAYQYLQQATSIDDITLNFLHKVNQISLGSESHNYTIKRSVRNPYSLAITYYYGFSDHRKLKKIERNNLLMNYFDTEDIVLKQSLLNPNCTNEIIEARFFITADYDNVEQINEYFNNYKQQFTHNIMAAITDSQKIAAIILFISQLECSHFFQNGNNRLYCQMLLNRLFKLYDLPLAILFFPNGFSHYVISLVARYYQAKVPVEDLSTTYSPTSLPIHELQVALENAINWVREGQDFVKKIS